MTHLKNFSSAAADDRLNHLFQQIYSKCRELEFLKLIVSFILTGKGYEDRNYLFYDLLIKKAEEQKDKEILFSLIIKELVNLLLFQEETGLAFYYSFHIHNPGHQLHELRKRMKTHILSDFHQTTQKLKILVLDDCPAALRLIEKKLAAYNQAIETFTDPSEARNHLVKNKHLYDIIICDYQIPETNGIDFLQEIRGFEKQENTLFVLYSAALPPHIPAGIYGVSKHQKESLAGLVHMILSGKEALHDPEI